MISKKIVDILLILYYTITSVLTITDLLIYLLICYYLREWTRYWRFNLVLVTLNIPKDLRRSLCQTYKNKVRINGLFDIVELFKNLTSY
ncbi:MAG: hypothetical protein QXZ37_01035 [Sulfolobales archaeon]